MKHIFPNRIEMLCCVNRFLPGWNLVPHAASLKKAPTHYRCCQEYHIEFAEWRPVFDACPDGTHDRWSGTLECVAFRRGQGWNINDRVRLKRRAEELTFFAAAHGELAKTMYDLPHGQLVWVEGTIYQNAYFQDGHKPRCELTSVMLMSPELVENEAFALRLDTLVATESADSKKKHEAGG